MVVKVGIPIGIEKSNIGILKFGGVYALRKCEWELGDRILLAFILNYRNVELSSAQNEQYLQIKILLIFRLV